MQDIKGFAQATLNRLSNGFADTKLGLSGAFKGVHLRERPMVDVDLQGIDPFKEAAGSFGTLTIFDFNRYKAHVAEKVQGKIQGKTAEALQQAVTPGFIGNSIFSGGCTLHYSNAHSSIVDELEKASNQQKIADGVKAMVAKSTYEKLSDPRCSSLQLSEETKKALSSFIADHTRIQIQTDKKNGTFDVIVSMNKKEVLLDAIKEHGKIGLSLIQLQKILRGLVAP